MDDASAAIQLSLARAERLILGGMGDTLSVLHAANYELGKRLSLIAKHHGGPSGKYTEAHAQIYREQIRLVTDYLRLRLQGQTEEQVREAIRVGIAETVKLASMLEAKFTGITRPLALESQAAQDSLVRGVEASRIRQNASSWQRYGSTMTAAFERQLRVGQLMGLSHAEMISRLIDTGKPRGITGEKLHGAEPRYFPAPTNYVDSRYWAERIVRTETAHAYNAANISAMEGMRNTDFPDMQKKILAHFDNRTAPDSVAVHGQIRPLDGLFRDGAGREYLRPPGRPNDRETVIPWRPHWAEVEATEPPSPEEQLAAKAEATKQEQAKEHEVQQLAAAKAEQRAKEREQRAALAAAKLEAIRLEKERKATAVRERARERALRKMGQVSRFEVIEGLPRTVSFPGATNRMSEQGPQDQQIRMAFTEATVARANRLFSAAERAALGRFTEHVYGDIRDAHGATPSSYAKKRREHALSFDSAKANLELINSALRKSAESSEPGRPELQAKELYRGIAGLTQREFEGITRSQHQTWNKPTSTSWKAYKAEEFFDSSENERGDYKVYFRIKPSKNTKALAIEGISSMTTEGEFIYGNGVRLNVTKVTKVDGYAHAAIVYLEEI